MERTQRGRRCGWTRLGLLGAAFAQGGCGGEPAPAPPPPVAMELSVTPAVSALALTATGTVHAGAVSLAFRPGDALRLEGIATPFELWLEGPYYTERKTIVAALPTVTLSAIPIALPGPPPREPAHPPPFGRHVYLLADKLLVRQEHEGALVAQRELALGAEAETITRAVRELEGGSGGDAVEIHAPLGSDFATLARVARATESGAAGALTIRVTPAPLPVDRDPERDARAKEASRLAPQQRDTVQRVEEALRSCGDRSTAPPAPINANEHLAQLAATRVRSACPSELESALWLALGRARARNLPPLERLASVTAAFRAAKTLTPTIALPEGEPVEVVEAFDNAERIGGGYSSGRFGAGHVPKTQVRLRALTAEGALGAEQVAAPFEAAQSRLLACYAQGLPQNPNLEGRAVFALRVGIDGWPGTSTRSSSTFWELDVLRCVQGVLEHTRYPSAPAPSLLTVELDFIPG